MGGGPCALPPGYARLHTTIYVYIQKGYHLPKGVPTRDAITGWVEP